MFLKKEKVLKDLSFFFIIATIAYALFFIFFLLFGSYEPLRPTWIPSYFRSISLLLGGLALLAAFYSKWIFAVRAVGAILLVADLLQLISPYSPVFTVPLGHQEPVLQISKDFFLIKSIWSLNFLFLGITFLVWSRTVFLLAPLLVFFISTLGATLYFFAQEFNPGWRDMFSICVCCTFGTLFLSSGIITTKLYQNIENKIKLTRPIVITVVFGIFFVAFFSIKELEISSEVFKNASNILFLGGFLFSTSLALSLIFLLRTKEQLVEIESSRHQLLQLQEESRAALTSAQAGMWSLDLKTNRVIWDDYMHLLFGVEPKRFKGTLDDVMESIHPKDRNAILSNLKNAAENGARIDSIFRVIRSDGSTHFIRGNGQLFYDAEHKPISLKGICFDVTDMMLSQNYGVISEAIAQTLANGDSFHQVITDIFQILNNYMGWEVIIIWENSRSPNLHCTQFISSAPEKHVKFQQAVQNTTITKGEPLAGVAWATSKLAFSRNISEEEHFLRTDITKEENLQGSIAVPIFANGTIHGIIELYKSTPFIEQMDSAFISLMHNLGRGVGQFQRRKIAEAERDELASVVKAAPDAIYIYTLDGKIKSWNPGAEHLFGWEKQEILGQEIYKILPSEQYAEHKQTVELCKQGKVVSSFETVRKKKDGTLFWVTKSASPIYDSEGQLIAISNILRDISKEKREYLSVAKNEEKFRAFVETTADWVWEITSDGLFTYSNPSVYPILGYSAEEIIGKDLSSLLYDTLEKKRIKEEIAQSVVKQIGWTQRMIRLCHKNGQLRYLQGSAAPHFNETQKLIGFRGSDRDITETVKLENIKAQFVSIISHELRTPLTSIFGSLGLLVQKEMPPEAYKELLTIAYRNSERLLHIVNDILDVEKLAQPNIKIPLQPVPILKVIQEALSSIHYLAEKSQITMEIQGEIRAVVLGNYERLMQVIINLLSNAIKFSNVGNKVTVSVELFPDTIRVNVIDRGVGISEELKPKIFSRFVQCDSLGCISTAGSGLGLSICKSIIEQLHGQIGFSSKFGEGSTFYFDLPLYREGHA